MLEEKYFFNCLQLFVRKWRDIVLLVIWAHNCIISNPSTCNDCAFLTTIDRDSTMTTTKAISARFISKNKLRLLNKMRSHVVTYCALPLHLIHCSTCNDFGRVAGIAKFCSMISSRLRVTNELRFAVNLDWCYLN